MNLAYLNGINLFTPTKLLIFILITFLSFTTHAAKKEKGPFPALNLPEKSQGQAAIQGLGDKLPEVAAWYGKTPTEFSDLLRSDNTLWLDKSGRIFFVEKRPNVQNESSPPAPTSAPLSHTSTLSLHSKPDSTKVIYLDFTGFFTTGRAWNVSYGEPIDTEPFDLDGLFPVDEITGEPIFNDDELAVIQAVWQQVAEDFAPFDVDVTTEDPGQDAITRGNNDEHYGTRVVITADFTSPPCNCGGFAYLSIFDSINEYGQASDYYKPAFVFYDNLGSNAKNIAEAATHEAGHNLGLQHDGVSGGSSYYYGHGGNLSVPTSWAPIMGVGYGKSVTQWSKGEYLNANNTPGNGGDDDIAVMQSNGALLRSDDHGDVYTNATTLLGTTDNGTVTLTPLSAIIERQLDADFFQVSTGNGALNIDVTPAPLYPNLDIRIELYDASGGIIETFNDPATLAAEISSYPVAAGIYYLAISGANFGDPFADPPTGYTDYGSLGAYTINGNFPESGGLQPPVAAASASPISGFRPLSVQFTGDTSSDPDGDDSLLTYLWDFADNGVTSTVTNPQHNFTDLGSYDVVLTVTDSDTLMDTDTVTVTVNNNPPTVAPTASPYDGPAPLDVSFFSNAEDVDGTVASYDWQFGDGSSTQANPSHTYTQAGNYNVVLTVTDNDGDTATDNITINVSADPSVNTLHLDTFSIAIVANSSKGKGGNGNGNGGGGNSGGGGGGGGDSGSTQAKVNIVVVDENGTTMKNAHVTGEWSGDATGSFTKKTNPSGRVEFTSQSTTAENGTFTFTVTNVVRSGYTYTPEPGNETVSASF
ncbi:PKD domain-containing protein [Vibrio profundum]|uniref:PKD domain-containing protein n=1 Tax=Vibrio profundum TaxID=2910247 RepID=UPI003D13AB79